MSAPATAEAPPGAVGAVGAVSAPHGAAGTAEGLDSPLLRGVFRTLAALLLAAAAVTHLEVGFGETFNGVVAGGLVQLANLAALRWIARRLIARNANPAYRTSGAGIAVLFFFKILALVGGVWLMLKTLPVSIAGFAIGAALLLPAALLATFWFNLLPSEGAPAEGTSNRAEA